MSFPVTRLQALLVPAVERQVNRNVINKSNAEELFAPAIVALIRRQLSSKPDELPP